MSNFDNNLTFTYIHSEQSLKRKLENRHGKKRINHCVLKYDKSVGISVPDCQGICSRIPILKIFPSFFFYCERVRDFPHGLEYPE